MAACSKFRSEKRLFSKNKYCVNYKVTVLKNELLKKNIRNSCSDKVTELLCWSIYSEEVWRSSFSLKKPVLKKTDSLTLRVFMENLIWLLIRVAGIDRERNHRLCLCPTIFIDLQSCMCHKQRTVSISASYCYYFSLGACFCSKFNNPTSRSTSRFKEFSFELLVVVRLFFEKREN